MALLTLIPLQHSQCCLSIYEKKSTPAFTLVPSCRIPPFWSASDLLRFFLLFLSITSCFPMLMYNGAWGGLMRVRWIINKPAEGAVAGWIIWCSRRAEEPPKSIEGRFETLSSQKSMRLSCFGSFRLRDMVKVLLRFLESIKMIWLCE